MSLAPGVDLAHIAHIGLGANLGDPAAQLNAALARLREVPEIEINAISSFYRSAAIGPPGQPDYCNAVCAITTRLDPASLLDHLQRIEVAAGRQRGEHWGPRVLDLDLLCFDDVRLATARLKLPHPQLQFRAFVLVPLYEIAPGLQIPGFGPLADLLAAVDRSQLTFWNF